MSYHEEKSPKALLSIDFSILLNCNFSTKKIRCAACATENCPKVHLLEQNLSYGHVTYMPDLFLFIKQNRVPLIATALQLGRIEQATALF